MNMADANGSASAAYDLLKKLEVTRWSEFTLWLVVFVVGVPGNLLILAVYLARRLRTTTHIFIASLALADLLECLLKFVDALALASAAQFLSFDRQSAVHFLGTGVLYTTAFLTAAIAFDRFDAVCRSLCRTMTLTRAKVIVISCFLAGFIAILPEVGQKIYANLYTETEQFPFLQSVAQSFPAILYIVCLIIVAMSYGAIFVFIRKRGRRLAAGERPHQGANIISGRCQDNNQPIFPQSPRSPGTPIGGCTSHQPHQSIPIVPSSSPQHLVVLGSHQSIPFVGAARSQSQTDKAANSKLTNQLFTVTSSRLPRPAGEEETPAGCSWELVSSEHLPATPLGAVQSSPLETHQPSADISRLGRHSAIQLAPVLSNTRVSPTSEMLQPPTHSSRDSDGISPSSTERLQDGNQGLRRRQAATQSRITKMLFIATFIFFILWFPWVYLRFYALGSLQKDFKKSSHHANLVAALIVLKDIAYLNSVINAFIYGMANKRFRAECKQLLQNVRQRFS